MHSFNNVFRCFLNNDITTLLNAYITYKFIYTYTSRTRPGVARF